MVILNTYTFPCVVCVSQLIMLKRMSDHFKYMSGQTHVTPSIMSGHPKKVIIVPVILCQILQDKKKRKITLALKCMANEKFRAS